MLDNKNKPTIKYYSLLLLLNLILFPLKLSGQEVCEPAISLETVVTGDFVQVFTGGANRQKEFDYLGMEDIILTISTQGCGLWEGGTLTLHGLNTHGFTPTEQYVNDLQVFTNIEAGDHTGFYELNYSQNFGSFTIMFGQHDLNAEFCGSEYAGLYLNSSFGITPTIALNIPVSIFPVASPCMYFSYTPTTNSIIRTAIYDGVPGDIESNKYNLEFKMGGDEGYLTIAEYEINRFEEKGDKYKLGAYYHSGEFLNNLDTTEMVKGNFGFYGVIDKNIIPPSGDFDNGLNFFLQLGFAPAGINLASYYIGTGINCRGFFKKQIHDILGIGIAHVGISRDYKKIYSEILSYETAIEMTYQLFIGENYTIQPNLQYIINPGATEGIDNALVGIVRLSLSF